MGVRNQNSTSYVHPDEPNLLNLHKTMQYNNLGEPVIRAHIDGITLEGDVIVSDVTINNTTENPVPVTIQNECLGIQNCGDSVLNIAGAVTQGTDPWVISGNSTPNGPDNEIYVKVTNEVLTIAGNVSIIVGEDPVSLNNPMPVSLGDACIQVSNCGADGVLNVTSAITVEGVAVTVENPFPVDLRNNCISVQNCGEGSLTINGNVGLTFDGQQVGEASPLPVSVLGEVEVKNDLNNPLPISRNTTTNSASNPIYVSGASGGVDVSFPESAVTAFEEPYAVTIVPILQYDGIYGLDPDNWQQRTQNSGTVTCTDSVWSVSATTATNSYARLRTTKFARYQPGQGMMVRFTAGYTCSNEANTLGVTNSTQIAGYFTIQDGYMFGFSGKTGIQPGTATTNQATFGILHRYGGKAETRTLTITRYPTGSQTATLTLNGTVYTFSTAADTSISHYVATLGAAIKANATLMNSWDVDVCGATMVFTYYTSGPQTGTFSFSSAGTGTTALGTFARTLAGVAATEDWTYYADWNGTKPTGFNPTKLNVFAIDFRWLGAGIVRFFMEDPTTGKMLLVHTQHWTSLYTVAHITTPSCRIGYRVGSNQGLTPAANTTVIGASVFAANQGLIQQTGSSQGYFNLDTTNRAQNTVHHLISIQNPYVRNGLLNASSLFIQTVTVAVQSTDPSLVYIVKNAQGTSDKLEFALIPGQDGTFYFAQYSTSAVSETLSQDKISNVQTLGINGNSEFDLEKFNFSVHPGERISVFISSTNAISKSSVGMTWRVD